MEFNKYQQESDQEKKKNDLITREFIRKAKEVYKIESIYYPACGRDKILAGLFPDEKIFYVDSNIRERTDGNFFYGDYANQPFEQESIDTLFLKDVHLKESGYKNENHLKRLEALLKPVKPNGVVIAARFGCKIWELDVPFVRNSGLVTPTQLAFRPAELDVFLKK